MATFPGVLKTGLAMTTSFLWPATSATRESLAALGANDLVVTKEYGHRCHGRRWGNGRGRELQSRGSVNIINHFGCRQDAVEAISDCLGGEWRKRYEKVIVIRTDREIVGSDEVRRFDGPRGDRHGHSLRRNGGTFPALTSARTFSSPLLERQGRD